MKITKMPCIRGVCLKALLGCSWGFRVYWRPCEIFFSGSWYAALDQDLAEILVRISWGPCMKILKMPCIRGVCTKIFWDALGKIPHEDLARSSLAGASMTTFWDSLRGPGMRLVSCCLWQTQVPAAAVLLQFWQCLTWFAVSVPTTALISYILFHWFHNPPRCLGSLGGVIV